MLSSQSSTMLVSGFRPGGGAGGGPTASLLPPPTNRSTSLPSPLRFFTGFPLLLASLFSPSSCLAATPRRTNRMDPRCRLGPPDPLHLPRLPSETPETKLFLEPVRDLDDSDFDFSDFARAEEPCDLAEDEREMAWVGTGAGAGVAKAGSTGVGGRTRRAGCCPTVCL